MLLDTYLTEYDEDLTGEVYIDPLGVLVIWSAYGQEIFQNKVNSISNDVRNYTLNLLNHTVIKSLIDDESVKLNPAFINATGDKRSLQFKQACLIYLENIFTYSVSNPDVPKEVDSTGVLGSSKARKQWDEEAEDPVIYFSDKEKFGRQRYHLLVRQLGLGVSGRYKTPFSQIGFFDGQYDYHYPSGGKIWTEVDKLLKSSKLMKKVFEQARAHLIWLIENHTRKAQMPPAVYFSDIPTELKVAFQKALPNSQIAGKETRDFWLRVTKLNQGAAGALLKELEKYADSENKLLDYVGLFTKAEKDHVLSDKEKRKLTDIQVLEPLLGELDLLFQLARYRKKHSIKDVVDNWEKLDRNSSTLPNLVNRVNETIGLKEVVSGTALTRLNQLVIAASQSDVEQQLRELLEYHAKVMRVRGQQPWVEVVAKDTIKVHGRTTKLSNKDDRPINSWVNNYYIPQFLNLVQGFRGVME